MKVIGTDKNKKVLLQNVYILLRPDNSEQISNGISFSYHVTYIDIVEHKVCCDSKAKAIN